MKSFGPLAAASILAGLAATPAAAQNYSQGDAQAQRIIGGIINSLIGNRYNVSDRQAIRRCSFAAVNKAENDFRPWYRGQPYAYPDYRGYVRVTAITDVTRGSRGVHVRGLLDTAKYGYQRGPRGADTSFVCSVDYRGNIYSVRLQRNPLWRR